MYLIKLGFGRRGRFDGFDDIGVNKASFQLAKTLSDDWKDDELFTTFPQAVLLRALCLKAGWDRIDLSEFENDPQTISAMQRWKIEAVQAPYQDVHAIMIFNTNT